MDITEKSAATMEDVYELAGWKMTDEEVVEAIRSVDKIAERTDEGIQYWVPSYVMLRLAVCVEEQDHVVHRAYVEKVYNDVIGEEMPQDIPLEWVEELIDFDWEEQGRLLWLEVGVAELEYLRRILVEEHKYQFGAMEYQTIALRLNYLSHILNRELMSTFL